MRPELGNYTRFRAALNQSDPEPALERLGRFLRFARTRQEPNGVIDRLLSDIAAFVEARDFWHAQAEAWEREYHKVTKHNTLRR